jgi:hypothetical protein
MPTIYLSQLHHVQKCFQNISILFLKTTPISLNSIKLERYLQPILKSLGHFLLTNINS